MDLFFFLFFLRVTNLILYRFHANYHRKDDKRLITMYASLLGVLSVELLLLLIFFFLCETRFINVPAASTKSDNKSLQQKCMIP